ncbi:hypothetical protein [Shimia sp. SDUM112013]|uniref:hypothetical protein n=1 Tax=Shimia sp. SDUM112013 TaxID=3136160 RepID=UPI0032F06A44
MKVSEQERGLIRIFSIDPEAEPPLMSVEPDWTADPHDPPWPLRDALGAKYLDSDFIELFDVADLGEMGLSGYLVEGLGVDASALKEDRQQLDALKGHVLIVLSSAFGGFAQTLAPRAPLRWVGTYFEDRPPVVYAPLPSESAKGPVAPPKNTPSAPSGNPHLMVLLAIIALPVLLAVLALLAFLFLR